VRRRKNNNGLIASRTIKLTGIAASAAAACVFHSPTASAGTVTILNNSFENGTGYHAQADPPSDWAGSGHYFSSGSATVQAPNVVTAASIGATGATGAVDGNNVMSFGVNSQYGLGVGEPNGTPSIADGYGGVGTDSLGTYAANTTYTLTAALGGNGNADWADVIGLSANFSGYAALASQVGNTTVNAGLLSSNFVNYSYVVDTATDPGIVGQDIGAFLAVESLIGSQYGNSEDFDNFVLTTTPDAVPEPASASLILLGAVPMLMRRRQLSRTL
jgi:hypothetical protein